MSTTRIRGGATLGAAFLACSLVACGTKPPECNDPQAVATAKEIVIAETRRALEARYARFPADVKRKLETDVVSYMNTLDVKLDEIVSNGYSSESKKNSCGGKLTVASKEGAAYSVRTGYTLQAIAEGGGKFYMEMDNAATLVAAAAQNFEVQLVDRQIREENVRKQAPAPPADPASLDAAGEFKSGEGSVRLERHSDTINFAINSAIDHHTCELKGQARLSGLVAQSGPISKDNACEVTLKFGPPGTVEIETKECSYYCGQMATGSMDATYKK
ncbi:hypothetical protein FN976_20435 [Caenimonas sedimenti]|uniref:Lipoprotein n=1 Tax=Caenimonas sedimenti TaxID=2596921 RepID=A0A562ZL76_9BURK|nr:hypothetical protein [Caenimonas sedimenti]TWO69106.1 hypothetical protein FN976_20435 [Caenimonas sedimenti]